MRRSPVYCYSALEILLLTLVGISECAAAQHFNPEQFFAPPALYSAIVSPTGDWAAALARNEDSIRVVVQRRGSREPTVLYSTRSLIDELHWIGPDTLLVLHPQDEKFSAHAIRVSESGGKIVGDELRVRQPGALVGILGNENILWAGTENQQSVVYRGTIESFSSGATWSRSRGVATGDPVGVAQLPTPVLRWVADRNGVVRAAFAISGRERPVFVLFVRSSEYGTWREVWRRSEAHPIVFPLAFSEDGERVIAASHASGDKMGLHEFDPSSRKFVRKIFSRPDVDIVDASLDASGLEVIAAISQEGGIPHYHYLDDYREKYLGDAAQIAPGQSVAVTSASRDHRYFSLLVRGPRNPGTYFLYDRETREKAKLGDVLSGIPEGELPELEAIDLSLGNGHRVQAFVARPPRAGTAKLPLVVLPHGGPIDVQDDLSFDPLLQYLVNFGFAVLKVNYRGSAGYGRAFLESGKREWGRGIEADIDAAVDQIVARGVVAPERICIAGASYGGYSALISAIRRPERYRCVATLNGPTDLPLLFHTGDISASDAGYDYLVDWVGDPARELDRLIELSPVYRTQDLAAPVLIAVGTDDVRVDPEHAYRLKAMLDRDRKPYEWLELADCGHSPNPEQYLRFARYLRDFVRKHLALETPTKSTLP